MQNTNTSEGSEEVRRQRLYGITGQLHSTGYSSGFLTQRKDSPLMSSGTYLRTNGKLKGRRVNELSLSSLNASIEREVPPKYLKLFDRQFLGEDKYNRERDLGLTSLPTETTKLSLEPDRVKVNLSDSKQKEPGSSAVRDIPPLRLKKSSKMKDESSSLREALQSEEGHLDDIFKNSELRMSTDHQQKQNAGKGGRDVSFLNEFKYQKARKNDAVMDYLEGKHSLITPAVQRDFKSILNKTTQSSLGFYKILKSDANDLESHYETSLSRIKKNLEELQNENLKSHQPLLKLISPDHLPEIEKSQCPAGLTKRHMQQTLNSVADISFHTSQNKNLKNPTGRKEVELLDKWLTEMIRKIQLREAEGSSRTNVRDLVEEIQLVYAACIKELVRQVSIQCTERGQLLDRVWNAYVDLLEKSIIEGNRELSLAEKHYEDELERMRERNTLMVSKFMAKNENLQTEVKLLNEKILGLRNDKKYLAKKLEESERVVETLNNEINELAKQNQVLAKDNLKKLENFADYSSANRAAIENPELIKITSKEEEAIQGSFLGESFVMHLMKARTKLLEDHKKESERDLSPRRRTIKNPQKENIAQETFDQSGKLINNERKTLIINKSPNQQNEAEDEVKYTRSEICDTEDLALEMEITCDMEVQTDKVIITEDSPDEDKTALEVAKNFYNAFKGERNFTNFERNSELLSPLERYSDLASPYDKKSDMASPGVRSGKNRSIGTQTETFNFLKKLIERHSLNNIVDIIKGEKKNSESTKDFLSPLLKTSDPNTGISFVCENCGKSSGMNELEQQEELISNQLEKARTNSRRGAVSVDEMDPRNFQILNHFEKRANLSTKALGILKQKIKDSNLDDNVIDQVLDVIDKRQFAAFNSLKIGNQFVKLYNELQELKYKDDIYDMAKKKLEIDIKDDNFELEETKEKLKTQTIRSAQLMKEVLILSKKLSSAKKEIESLKESLFKKRSAALGEESPEQRKLNKYLKKISSEANGNEGQFPNFNERPSELLKITRVSVENVDPQNLENSASDLKNQNLDHDDENKNSECCSGSSDADQEEDQKKGFKEKMSLKPRDSKAGPNANQRKKSVVLLRKPIDLGLLTLTMPFKLGRRASTRQQNQNLDAAQLFFAQFKDGEAQSSKPKISNTSAGKQIMMVYLNLLEREKGLIQTTGLQLITYEIYLNKYGLKSVAEKKLIDLVSSCLIYKTESPRCGCFVEFLRLLEGSETSGFNFFVDLLKFHEESGAFTLPGKEAFLIGEDKALEFSQRFLKDRLSPEDFSDLTSEVARTFALNKKIELEICYQKILPFYEETRLDLKKELSDLFLGGDLDQDEIMEYSEFCLLVRNIESDSMGSKNLKSLYFSNADSYNPENGEKAITLDRFVNVAIEHKIFSREGIQKFKKNYVATLNYKDLALNWEKQKALIKLRLLKAEAYTQSFRIVFKKLEENLKGRPKLESAVLMNFALLESESRRIFLEFMIAQSIPSEFSQLWNTYHELKELESL